MNKGHVIDVMVKLTDEEIARLVKAYIGIVEVFASKFDGRYLDMIVKIKDYRKLLDDMDKCLRRAEELMAFLDAGGKE